MLSVVATVGLLLAPEGSTAPGPDLLPLHRMIVPANRLAMELERVRQGVLVQQPRAEFEALVKQAARALQRGQNPPRLLQARYQARLVGTSLAGSGDWTVVNATGVPGIWSIAGLNLALGRVKIGTRDAILGDLDGKTLGLLLDSDKHADSQERGKEQQVSFDWTLRGGQEAGGLHFDLQIPPCPIASLELTLPAEATVSVSRSVAVLSGPHEASDPGQRLWRLHFSDRSAVDFIVRYSDELPRTAPLLLANLTNVQRLTPARLRADFDFQVEVLHRPVTRLNFDVDPMLEPFDVSLRNFDLKEWKIIELGQINPRAANGLSPQLPLHRRLLVELREPFLGTMPSLRVRCLARLPSDRPWTSPWMRLHDAAIQGETLKLELHPDVRLEHWQPGGFRLVGTSTSQDGLQILTLVGTEANLALQPARPAAQVRTQGVDFLARQRTWWQIGSQGSSLTAEITYEVSRGSLIELPVVLPNGWQVNDVAMEPKELLRNWVPVSTGGRSTVVVDLQHGLTPRQQARLTILLHSNEGRTMPADGAVFDFPELAPQDSCVREGILAITVDPLLEATLLRAPLPAMAPDSAGPWGPTHATFTFHARNQPITGAVRVKARPPRIQAACHGQFVLAPGNTGMSLRLELEALSGTARSLDVLITAPVPEGVTWRCVSRPEFLRGVQRLPAWDAAHVLLAVGQRDALAASCALSHPCAGQRWRLMFNFPLKKRETFLLEGTLAPTGGPGPGSKEAGGSRQLPLVTVPGAAIFEGEVGLHLAGTEILEVTSPGLIDRAAGTKSQAAGTREETSQTDASSGASGPIQATAWRTYRYANARPLMATALLAVRARGLPSNRAAQEACDHARLVTTVKPEGGLVHSFSFGVWNWRRHIVPVRLPLGSTLLTAQVDGRWIDELTPAELPDAVEVSLPVTTGDRLHQLEILYATSQEWPTWAVGTSLAALRPELPVPPVSFRQIWRLPTGIVPMSSEKLRKLPSLRNAGGASSLWEKLGTAWATGSTTVAEVAGLPVETEWAARQRQVLEAAETALRQEAHPGQPWSLASAFERLALALSKDGYVVVLDAPALQAARLSPQTRFVMPSTAASGEAWRPFWESLGLAHVLTRAGVLLTTRTQLDGRQLAGGSTEVLSASLERAIRDAGTDEQDASSRFLSVWDWMAEDRGPWTVDRGPANASRFTVHASRFTLHGPRSTISSLDWDGTEWEVPAGDAGAGRITVVRQHAVNVVGLLLTGWLLLLAWSVRHILSARRRFLLLIAWLAVAGLAVLWLPAGLRAAAWGPAVASLLTALCWYGCVVWRHQKQRRGTRSEGREKPLSALTPGSSPLAPRPSPLAPLLMLFAVLGLARAHAQQPEAYPVLLVPTTKEDQEMALVTPDLLARLRRMSESAGLPAREVVPVRAAYDGKVSQGRAEFKAEFQLHSFTERSTLHLPLIGVELQEGTLVDGIEANPTILPGPQGGYGVRVIGRGPHSLKLSFTCRIAEAGEQADISFGVPRLPQCQVAVTLPAGSDSAAVLTALGFQRVSAAENGRVRVEADLGREDSVHLRWRTPSRSPRSTAVQVREAYLWDLRQPVPSLTAVLNYTPAGGTLRHFAIKLPQHVVVRSVEARQAGAAPESASPPRLKAWRVVDGRRGTEDKRREAGPDARASQPPPPGPWLEVDLQTPFAGPVQLVLGLVPQLATDSSALLLALPTPVDAQPSEGYVAYRVKDWDALDRADHLGVTNLPGQGFVQVWTAAGMADPGLPTRAYTFRRTPDGIPAIVLTLQELRARATQEINWHIQSGFAEVRARAELDSTHENVMLIEWTVPSDLTVAEVHGADVDHWSRTGDRVQAWLRAACKTTRLELTGWIPWNPGSGNRKQESAIKESPLAPGHLPVSPEGQVALAPVSLATGDINETLVRIASGPGLSVEPAQLQNLTAVPAQEPNVLRYLAKPPAYRALLNVRPAPSRTRVEGPGLSRTKESPSTTPPTARAVQILSCEQHAALSEVHHWVHQAVYRMIGKSSDILLKLPAGARLLGLVLDDKPLSPEQPSPQSLLIRLPDNAEPHRLAVRWSFDVEPIEKPNLTSPHFEGLVAPAAVWVVNVPRVYKVKGEIDSGHGSADRAEVELRRAAAMYQLSVALAQTKDSGTAARQAQIRGAQQSFFGHLRRADSHLALMAAASPSEAGRSAQLRARMNELRDENLRRARMQHLEKIRIEAEDQPEVANIDAGDAFFTLPSHGKTTYWLSDTVGRAPRLRLVTVSDQSVRRTVLASVLLILLLAGLMLLWKRPRLASWICWFWPEQLMLLALLACRIFGWSPLGVALLMTGVIFRLVWVALTIQRRLSAVPRLSGQA
jgi:hypothetical protein